MSGSFGEGKITFLIFSDAPLSEVPCFDCDFVYIEQTKRDLKSRLAEHKLTIRNQEPEKSVLCEHSIQFDHLINRLE